MRKCRTIADKILKKDLESIQLSDNDLLDYISECQVPITQNVKLLSHKRNIINPDLYCALVTKKCDPNRYYQFIYNPKFWMNDRSNSEIVNIQELIESNQDYFDLTPHSKCCNCISIVLNVENANIDILKYITSITRTAKNVFKCLPNWIVRLYLDVSVYDYINTQAYSKSFGKDVINKGKILVANWNYLHNAENVEIYTFICDDSSYSTLRKRSLRFAILYDSKVNVAIIREADGIVTVQDCHNINVFANSNKIMYLTPFNTFIKCATFLSEEIGERFSYAPWLAIYKDHIANDYFSKNWNLYEILAGTFGLKLKLSKNSYLKTISNLRNLIFIPIKGKYDPKTFFENSSLRIPFDIPLKGSITDFLNIGFDELILLQIFRDFISFPYNSISTSLADKHLINHQIQILETGLKKIELIESIVSSFHDTFSVDNNDLLTDLGVYREITYRYGMCHTLYSTNKTLDKAYEINRERFYNILGTQDIFQRITQSQIFTKSSDVRFNKNYFLDKINSKEYTIDMFGIHITFLSDFYDVDAYFSTKKLYQGKEISYLPPFLLVRNAFLALSGPEYSDKILNTRTDRFDIYNIYKDSCLYNNIKIEYSKTLINVSGLSEPLSVCINRPYLSQDESVDKYVILESIYSVLD